MIRISAGELAGRIIEQPKTTKTRPLTAKVRASIFNRLGDIEGLSVKETNSNEVILTPLTSFKWRVRGGPYKWDLAGMGDLEVFINDIKMGSGNSDRDSFLQPTITCPNS